MPLLKYANPKSFHVLWSIGFTHATASNPCHPLRKLLGCTSEYNVSTKRHHTHTTAVYNSDASLSNTILSEIAVQMENV
eukprot:2261656-Amphidinium_carterae.1